MRIEDSIDTLIRQVHALDRAGCIGELRALRQLRLDFTDEFLHSLSLERLQHILMAAVLQARRRGGLAPAHPLGVGQTLRVSTGVRQAS